MGPSIEAISTGPLVILLVSAFCATAKPVDPSSLVDIDNYPPYFDAIKKVAGEAGIHGIEAVPGYSVFDEGVRVMPVKVGMTGKLSQLADLLGRLETDFPFPSRIDKVALEPTRQDNTPYKLGLLLLSPVKPMKGSSPSKELEKRLESDRRFQETLGKVLDRIVGAEGSSHWLQALSVAGDEIAIRGQVSAKRDPDPYIHRLLTIDGLAISEISGPQRDPESGEIVFIAKGLLDLSPPGAATR